MSLADYACADEPAHVFAYHADCLTFLRTLPDDWTHAIITDPPYGLADHKADVVATAITAWAAGDRERVPTGRGFMGREWDAFVPPPAVWDECLRVLKPGGHLAVFAGSRTVDLMGLSIRLAGFEMRDGIAAWLYGSGFPKSLDVGKAVEATLLHGGANSSRIKAANAAREVIGPKTYLGGTRDAAAAHLGPRSARNNGVMGEAQAGNPDAQNVTAPATDAAREWQGWGTALKPAHEPILLARKPLSGTVAANVLAHGTGAVNIDACRVTTSATDDIHAKSPHTYSVSTGFGQLGGQQGAGATYDPAAGRWPTNVVLAHHPGCHDEGECHGDCQVAALDEQSGNRRSSGVYDGDGSRRPGEHATDFGGGHRPGAMYDDTGGASRFFPTFRYQAKAPKSERPIVDGTGHPTVKPLGLMRWLVRLLVPGEDGAGGCGAVLDPFAGSGATLEAARLEGRRAVGVERDEHSVRLIAARLGVEYRELPTAPEPVHEATPTEALLEKVAGAESIDVLMELYRYALGEELWTDEVRAAFSARRLEIEGAAA